MRTLSRGPAITENAPIYHFPDGDPMGAGEAVRDGWRECPIAAHQRAGRVVYDDVAPGHNLPEGWRWASPAELDAVRATHPGAHLAQTMGASWGFFEMGATWGLFNWIRKIAS